MTSTRRPRNLQELSRGIHPAIPSQGGLLPALRALARRSTVPVELDLAMRDRLPEAIEVALYYVASESLTNTVKHAAASFVSIAAAEENGVVHLSIHDDGIGGADPKRGSGLIGLRDRVEALGGTIEVESEVGLTDVPALSGEVEASPGSSSTRPISAQA